MAPKNFAARRAHAGRERAQQDAWRKRLYFRSCHRGQRELDILFARFARRVLPRLSASRVAEYQALLDIPDSQLLAWVLRAEPLPRAPSALLKQFVRQARR